MGYEAFYGEFKLDRPLTREHSSYLKKFSRTRRIARDSEITKGYPDPIRNAMGLPVGEQGGYFVGGDVLTDNNAPDGILDHSRPPSGQPGLWCKWIPTGDDSGITWNGYEKFYDYTEWLIYITDHFLKPWGYVLNGKVSWVGEERDDRGVIHVKNNCVQAISDEIISPEPVWD